jgi:hypothetical protein
MDLLPMRAAIEGFQDLTRAGCAGERDVRADRRDGIDAVQRLASGFPPSAVPKTWPKEPAT